MRGVHAHDVHVQLPPQLLPYVPAPQLQLHEPAPVSRVSRFPKPHIHNPGGAR